MKSNGLNSLSAHKVYVFFHVRNGLNPIEHIIIALGFTVFEIGCLLNLLWLHLNVIVKLGPKQTLISILNLAFRARFTLWNTLKESVHPKLNYDNLFHHLSQFN